MTCVPVTSSNIRSVGYDAGTQSMDVEFHDGGVHRYHDVPTRVHEGLMGAESKGGYFAEHVRRVGYRKSRP